MKSGLNVVGSFRNENIRIAGTYARSADTYLTKSLLSDENQNEADHSRQQRCDHQGPMQL